MSDHIEVLATKRLFRDVVSNRSRLLKNFLNPGFLPNRITLLTTRPGNRPAMTRANSLLLSSKDCCFIFFILVYLSLSSI